jgi:hypothetical protein
MLTTIRFAAAVSALLTALVGALYVFDVVEAAAARETLGKTLVVVVIFTLAALAVVALSRPKRQS